ncbi:hypothetical protein [Aeromonas veronii]|uniref:hypothetical protein n=1 Tax=Aeromonas veronii TaxID=654 RepID=UPI001D0985E5|nr:hypothetical protein [Aeromonas veronii]
MAVRVYDERQKILKKIREDRYKKKQIMSGRYPRAFYATDDEYYAAKKVIDFIRNGTATAIDEIHAVLSIKTKVEEKNYNNKKDDCHDKKFHCSQPV